jgi:hypothetical protein
MSMSPVIESGVEIARHCRGGAGDGRLLIAVGIGALFIASMSASRAARPSIFTAPCSETCSRGGYRRSAEPVARFYRSTTVEHCQPWCIAATASEVRLASETTADAHRR